MNTTSDIGTKAANVARNEANASHAPRPSRASPPGRRVDWIDGGARLVAALVIATTAALIAPPLAPMLGSAGAHAPYYLAVVLAASTLGFACAFATIAASAIALLLQSPSSTSELTAESALGVLAFVATGIAIAVVLARLPRERERACAFARAARAFSRERDDAREAREALRTRMLAQAAWHETALQAVEEAVVCTDDSGRIRFINRAAERLTQVASADALGRRIDQVLRLAGESGGVDVAASLRDAIANGATFSPSDPLVLIKREGVRGAVHCSVAPVRSHTGALLGAVTVVTDGRRTRRADRERSRLIELARQAASIAVSSQRGLDLAERKFAAFMAELPFPAYIVGEDGAMIFVNDAGEREPGWRHALAQTRVGGARECVIEVPDEGRRYVDVRFPIRSSDRAWTGGLSIDITDQSRAERELRERSDELIALLRHVPIAVWIARGTDARDVQCNAAARALAAERRDWAPIRKCIAERRAVRDADCELATEQGRTRTLRMTAVPLFDPTGEPCGALAFAVDATPDAEYEAVLSRVAAPSP
jgi:PAS domain-containing protein